MEQKIRYAVVGLGHIAQVAVLPGFKHAKNSELTALVSNDSTKLKKLSKEYGVSSCYSYNSFEECLESGEVDAVYIALPNNMHQEYMERAAHCGIHVLCEKPMAVTEKACLCMIKTARECDVKLMIAYRLHFQEANLEAIKIAQSGQLGDLRYFNSSFSMQVTDPNNIRLKKDLGGGTLYDIGIYCINAARYLFRDEPLEVTAISANNGEKRFREVDEMTSCILKFPNERIATFTCSFGAGDSAYYEIVGTKGSLCLDSAYEYAEGMTLEVYGEHKKKIKKYPKQDQFGAELTYFSDCILHDIMPEPSGLEGLADVCIINALYESAELGQTVSLDPIQKNQRPDLSQKIKLPPVSKPKTVHVTSPHN